MSAHSDTHCVWAAVRQCFVLGLVGLLMVGCTREDEIKQYPAQQNANASDAGKKGDALDALVDKGKSGGMPAIGGNTAMGGTSLQYDTPTGWTEVPPSGLRKAAFHVSDGDKRVEITVIPLSLAGGELLPNVNRWRGQVGLPEISQQEMEKTLKPIKTMGVEGKMVELVNAEATPPRALLAVIATRPDLVWFIKLFGDADLAKREKANFEALVKSIKVVAGASGHGAMPPAGAKGMPPAGAKRMPPMTGAAPHGKMPAMRNKPAPFTYTTPSGWKQGQIQGMRKAAFMVAKDKESAEVTVIDLSAAAGDLLSNVNRWRKQVELEPTTTESLAKAAKDLPVDGLTAKYVTLIGPEKPAPRHAMLGVIFIRGDRSWFAKMMGDAGLVQAEQTRFEQFVKSIHFGAADDAAKTAPKTDTKPGQKKDKTK